MTNLDDLLKKAKELAQTGVQIGSEYAKKGADYVKREAEEIKKEADKSTAVQGALGTAKGVGKALYRKAEDAAGKLKKKADESGLTEKVTGLYEKVRDGTKDAASAAADAYQSVAISNAYNFKPAVEGLIRVVGEEAGKTESKAYDRTEAGTRNIVNYVSEGKCLEVTVQKDVTLFQRTISGRIEIAPFFKPGRSAYNAMIAALAENAERIVKENVTYNKDQAFSEMKEVTLEVFGGKYKYSVESRMSDGNLIISYTPLDGINKVKLALQSSVKA